VHIALLAVLERCQGSNVFYSPQIAVFFDTGISLFQVLNRSIVLNMSPQTRSYWLAGLVVLFWSTSASAFKVALRLIVPEHLLLFATALSTLLLFLILFIQGKTTQLIRVPVKSVGKALVLGILNPFLYYLVLFKAYALLPGQIAMALNYGWPLVLTLLSVPLLRQSLTRNQLYALAVSFLGAVLIATQGQIIHIGDLSQLGIILAAVSTVLWAIFWLLNAQDGVDPAFKLFFSFCSGLTCILLYCSWFDGGIPWPPINAWFPLLYIALFEMSLTFILWLTALQNSSSTAKIGNLMYLTPFSSLLCLHLVVGEEIQLATCIGLVIIISSILYQAKSPKRAK
jgi:drug/metabolite transporter (DMT)-like permease